MWRKLAIMSIMSVFTLLVNATPTDSLLSVPDSIVKMRDSIKKTINQVLFQPDSIGEILPHTKKSDGYDSIVNVVITHKPTTKFGIDHERVIVGKDTISVILPGKNYSRYDRGLLNYLFIPRGQWILGATASFGEFNTEDVRLLSFMKDFNFNGKSMSVNPYAGYFYRSNQCVGIKLGFSRNIFELGSLSVDFDDDINFSLKDVEYSFDNYSASLFYRFYVGLDNNRRFALFNEVDLKLAAGNGKFLRYYNDEPRDTRTKATEVSLNFSPGLCIFVHEYVSFNMSLGVFGFYFKNEKQTTNSVEEGKRFSSGANFKFNIFNLNMGIAVHI